MIKHFFSQRSVQVGATILLSALVFYIAFRSFSWTEFLAAISRFDRRWLLPSIGLALIGYGVRALRWQVILQPIQPVPLPFLFQATVLGYFVNLVLPVNIGELVRAYLVKREYAVSIFTVLGSYAVERVFGLIAFWLVGLFAVLTMAVPSDIAQVRQRVLLGMGAGLVLLVALVLLVSWLRTNELRLGWLSQIGAAWMSPHWQIRLAGGWQRFRQGLQFGGTPSATFLILFYSILLRVLSALMMWSLAQGFGIGLPLLAYIFADVIVSVAHVAGSHLLGVVGSFEISLAYVLALFGASREIGLGVGLLMRAVYIFPLLVLGAIFFFTQGLSWADLQRLRQTAATDPDSSIVHLLPDLDR
jgi:glycosyltransferase 2 family protein